MIIDTQFIKKPGKIQKFAWKYHMYTVQTESKIIALEKY